MKTLRVCHSSDLPSIQDRDINFIYYLYDKLEIFLGQNYYSDPYAIVESYPENTDIIAGMLYFCLDDGYVKAQVNLENIKIAKIESDEQLEILKQAGTKFFVNADRRYLDFRTKTISLPFANGTYELTLSLANDLKINENTVIGFNPETQQFEIIGDIQDFDLVFSRRYRGIDTNTVETNVEDHKISSNVKLNPAYDNIIKETENGLYASVNDRVTSTVFEDWTQRFKSYKTDMEKFIEELTDLIERAEEIISTDAISRKILESLENVYPEIDTYLENYDVYAQKIDDMDTEIMDYAQTEFENTRSTLSEAIIEATNDPWEDFNNPDPEPTPDPDPEPDPEPEPDPDPEPEPDPEPDPDPEPTPDPEPDPVDPDVDPDQDNTDDTTNTDPVDTNVESDPDTTLDPVEPDNNSDDNTDNTDTTVDTDNQSDENTETGENNDDNTVDQSTDESDIVENIQQDDESNNESP